MKMIISCPLVPPPFHLSLSFFEHPRQMSHKRLGLKVIPSFPSKPKIVSLPLSLRNRRFYLPHTIPFILSCNFSFLSFQRADPHHPHMTEHLSLPPRIIGIIITPFTPRLFLVFHATPCESPFPICMPRDSLCSLHSLEVTSNPQSAFVSLHLQPKTPTENQQTLSQVLTNSRLSKGRNSAKKTLKGALKPTGFQRQVHQGGASSSFIVFVYHR